MITIAQLREAHGHRDLIDSFLNVEKPRVVVAAAAFAVLADAARELLTLREAGALIIVPDEELVERIRDAIRDEIYLLVDIETDPFHWQGALDNAAAGVLDALRDAMPDGDS